LRRVRVKVCGITRLEDALVAVEAGVDAVGFVFYEGSPRFVPPETAREIARNLPPLVCRVGVFVNAPRKIVARTAERVGLTALQFHGNETGDYCEGWNLPVIKAFRVGPEFSPEEIEPFASACAILLDGYHPHLFGGSGVRADWGMARRLARIRPLILAGGLDPANVAEAIRTVRPYGVDVSSGVEIRPGQKDPERVRMFMREVHRACESLEEE